MDKNNWWSVCKVSWYKFFTPGEQFVPADPGLWPEDRSKILGFVKEVDEHYEVYLMENKKK